VLDENRAVAERGSDPLSLAREEARPGRVVVDELDRPRERLQLADRDGAELRLSFRRQWGQVARTGVYSRDQSR